MKCGGSKFDHCNFYYYFKLNYGRRINWMCSFYRFHVILLLFKVAAPGRVNSINWNLLIGLIGKFCNGFFMSRGIQYDFWCIVWDFAIWDISDFLREHLYGKI